MKTLLTIILTFVISASLNAADKPKSILLMAGQPSHDWNEHDHHAVCEILAKALNNSGMYITASINYDSWPKDKKIFENADAIVFYCDGDEKHMALGHEDELEKASRKGAGIVCLHYSTASQTEALRKALTDTIGGYFENNWSVNPIWSIADAQLAVHPITQGVNPIDIKDEWYYHMRFRDNAEGITPILSAVPPANSVSKDDSPTGGNPVIRKEIQGRTVQHIAWAAVNKSGSRGFGFTGGHFNCNWSNNDFRKLVLNAIVWAAKAEVPENGIASQTPVILTNKSITQAIARGDNEDIKRHIFKGADVNEQNQSGWAPLHYATVRGNVEAAKILIENGADVNKKTETEKTALHFAADRNFIDLARLLLEHGASVIARDNEGWSSLHFAAAKSHVEMAELLLQKDAPVNMTSLGGGTPLHEAAASAKPEMIQILLKNKANPIIKAKNGKTSLDYAIELGNTEAEKLLAEAVAEISGTTTNP